MVTTQRRTAPDPASILGLLDAGDYLLPYTIRAVCLLDIAEHLADGPRTLTDLARVAGAHEPSLRTALRYLATRGIFAETEPGLFGLTPLADLLRSGHRYSARDIFLSPVVCTRAMEGLDHTLRTGEAAFDQVHGESMWHWFAGHPDDGVLFDRVMSGATGMELLAVVRASDWSRFGRVVDVGGGNGGFLSGLLGRFPAMEGVLFDLPGVVAEAPARLAAAGVGDRCTVVPGSFLEGPIPGGGDAYVLKRILYSWTDDEATGILRRIREAMPEHASVYIIEAGRTEENDSPLARRMDMLMLTLSAGGSRSLAEQEKLLAAAGLRLVATAQTPMFPVIEARAA